jgi:hypothetical protein
MEQSKVIDRRIENIWEELAKTVAAIDTTTMTSNGNAVIKSNYLDKERNETGRAVWNYSQSGGRRQKWQIMRQ